MHKSIEGLKSAGRVVGISFAAAACGIAGYLLVGGLQVAMGL